MSVWCILYFELSQRNYYATFYARKEIQNMLRHFNYFNNIIENPLSVRITHTDLWLCYVNILSSSGTWLIMILYHTCPVPVPYLSSTCPGSSPDFPWTFARLSLDFPWTCPILHPDWLDSHHPFPNAKYWPITLKYTRSHYHKTAKCSPPPCPHILIVINKLTLMSQQ